MSENFKKIKKKYLFSAIAECAVTGVSVGLLAVGAVWLSLKLAGGELSLIYYLLIGFGAALLAGLPLFFVLRPTDVSAAKKLDGTFALGEKAQTMVEFGGREGVIVGMQRTDADSKLGGLKVKTFGGAQLARMAVALALACAVFLTALFVSPYAGGSSSEVYAEPFSITEFQKLALEEMIANTESSSLESGLKQDILTSLTEFQDGLDEIASQTQLNAQVYTLVSGIDGAVADVNTYRTICLQLAKDAQTQSLSRYVQAGINFYLYVDPTVAAYAFSAVQTHEAKAAEEIGDRLYVRSSLLSDLFAVSSAEDDEDYRSQLTELIGNYVVALNSALKNAAVDDEVSQALAAYGQGLSALADGAGEKTQEDLEAELQSFFGNVGEGIAPALCVQSYNCMMDQYLRLTLSKAFNVSNLPSNTFSDGAADESSDDDDKEDNGGGAGNEDLLMAGKDYIYYPDDETRVVYTDKYSEYYSAMLEQLANSDLSDELREKIINYFSLLKQKEDS